MIEEAASFPEVFKSPVLCRAIDKERAWLDRINLSVSFSVVNKPKGKINRGRKRKKQPERCPWQADYAPCQCPFSQHGGKALSAFTRRPSPQLPCSTVPCFAQRCTSAGGAWHFGCPSWRQSPFPAVWVVDVCVLRRSSHQTRVALVSRKPHVGDL